MSKLFAPPSDDDRFYARALGILVGPTRRTAIALRVLSAIYWSFMIVCVGWLGAQVFDRGDPVRIFSLTATPSAIHAGEPVKVYTMLQRFKRCDVRLDWSIEDSRGEIFRFAPRFGHAPGPVGRDDYTTPYETSRGMAPGAAVLRITMQARCPGNYLQALAPLVMELPDVAFDVLPPARP